MRTKTWGVALALAAALLPRAWAQQIQSPLALQEAAEAATLPLKARLGRMLFTDKNLSEPRGQSCATCHSVEVAFSDPQKTRPTSNGARTHLFGKRNAPSAMYAAFSPAFHFDQAEQLFLGGQFLDGRAATLEEQAKAPLLEPLEMGNSSRQQVVDKVRAAQYADLFRRVYGPGALDDADLAFEHIADAIAAYERTPAFGRFTSKFDAWQSGKARLSAQELRGFAAFVDERKGNCAACHPVAPTADGTPALFTDFSYDNLGVPKSPTNDFYRMPAQFNPDGRTFVDKGLGATVNLAGEDGKFKVPSLRNVALTAPYMHNGYFTTLRGVVDFYNTRDIKPRCAQELLGEAAAHKLRCWPRPEEPNNVNVDELGRLGLNDQDVDDIVVFLHTLTDGWSASAR